LLDHPTRDHKAEFSQSTGDQVAAVGAPAQGRLARNRSTLADQAVRLSAPLAKRYLILAFRI